jgi:hypothetical protein
LLGEELALVVAEERATLLVVTTLRLAGWLAMRSMVVLGTMVFGGTNIIICGEVTFGVINDYETKITTGISI